MIIVWDGFKDVYRQEYQFDGNGESDSSDCEEFRTRTDGAQEGMDDIQHVVCETNRFPRQCVAQTSKNLSSCYLFVIVMSDSAVTPAQYIIRV